MWGICLRVSRRVSCPLSLFKIFFLLRIAARGSREDRHQTIRVHFFSLDDLSLKNNWLNLFFLCFFSGKHDVRIGGKKVKSVRMITETPKISKQ